MIMQSFKDLNFCNVPQIFIGNGAIKNISDWLRKRSIKSVILVIGGKFLERTGKLNEIMQFIEKESCIIEQVECLKESDIVFIDNIVSKNYKKGIGAVIAVGGGSVIDCGKAISAMLPNGNSIGDHLNLSNKALPHSGKKVPFLAIPTTSGTGAEATKNAVVTQIGKNGYKSSIRHENFISDGIIIDGSLLVHAPKRITIFAGFDALTQLLESYFSPKTNPLNDAIILSGLEHLIDNFLSACGNGSNDIDVRQSMGYAALCSGIGLANSDLGIVHGIAVPIGAHFPIPHGAACGTLLGVSLRTNFIAMSQRDPNNICIVKMSKIGQLLTDNKHLTSTEYIEKLIETIDNWTRELELPRLGEFGINNSNFKKIVNLSVNRNNPIKLTKKEIEYIIKTRI